jgi:nucleotide-binding universal stress UspA family protein
MQVLVPMDDSPLARAALAEALAMFPDARVTVLHVIDYVEEQYGIRMLVPQDELEERARRRAADLFEAAEEIASEAGRSVETVTRVGEPGREIVDYVESTDTDVVVMGSHGRSTVSKLFLGSVAETVLRRAPVPVTIVR